MDSKRQPWQLHKRPVGQQASLCTAVGFSAPVTACFSGASIYFPNTTRIRAISFGTQPQRFLLKQFEFSLHDRTWLHDGTRARKAGCAGAEGSTRGYRLNNIHLYHTARFECVAGPRRHLISCLTMGVRTLVRCTDVESSSPFLAMIA